MRISRRISNRFFRIAVAAGGLFLLSGCPATTPPKPPISPQQALVAPTPILPNYYLHLPGVAGNRGIDRAMVAGLQAGGVRGEWVVYDWTGNYPGLGALENIARNHEQARIVAAMIEKAYRADPRRKIEITAHSGGTGVLAWALEGLPPDVKVTNVLFLASALSPTYDLTPALAHITSHLYAFYSKDDQAVLSAGTRLLGTIDRVNTDAAGLVGFTAPTTADPAQYQKLIQFPYDPAWMKYDNPGDHIGTMSYSFAEHVTARLLDPTPLSMETNLSQLN